MAPNYSMDLQAQIPVALAAVFNFTCEHQPEENHDDGGEDEDGSQPIGGRVEVMMWREMRDLMSAMREGIR